MMLDSNDLSTAKHGLNKLSLKIVCTHIHNSSGWKLFFALVNLCYCISFSIYPEVYRDSFNEYRSPGTTGNGTINLFGILEFISLFSLVLEILVGCITLGFLRDKTSWLRVSYFHKIDFAVLLLVCLEYLLVYLIGSDRFPFRVLRLFRLLRPILRTDTFAELRGLLRTLSAGALQIGTVLLVLLFITLAFALFG